MRGLTREDFDDLVRIGEQLANVAFAFGQLRDVERRTLTQREKEIMRDLDRQWHAKLSEIWRKVVEAKAAVNVAKE